MSVYSAREFRGRKRSSRGGCNLVLLLVLGLSIFLVYTKRSDIVQAIQNRILELTAKDPAARLEGISKFVAPRLEEELSAVGLRLGAPIFIRVFKEEKLLEVWMEQEENQFVRFKTYPICSSTGEIGPKTKADKQGPEGFYEVSTRRLSSETRFYLEMDLGYPNAYDRHHKRKGSEVYIQGTCTSRNGSYALSNDSMEEVYALTEAALTGRVRSVSLHVFPFRMTDERMTAELEAKAEWLDFWKNLKEGYDYFEIVGKPPTIRVANGNYTFE